MWHPIDADDLIALARAGIAPPPALVWLNEAQGYLDGLDGEAAAAALRRLLTGPGPVVVLATMWTDYWQTLSAPPDSRDSDSHHQARQLLGAAHRLGIPETFTDDHGAINELRRLAGTDPRLAAAEAASRGDQRVIQILAGGVGLIERYEDATDPYGQAVLTAAMDTVRLGHHGPQPPELLEAAAPGYIADQYRGNAPHDWFDRALRYATAEIKGIAALTGIRRRAGIGPIDGYLLHDYLDQHGRTIRSGMPTTASLWDALVIHTVQRNDRFALAESADRRGLYRYVVRLLAPMAHAGDPDAMGWLVNIFDRTGRMEEAEAWCTRAVTAGDGGSMHYVADRMKRNGHDADHEIWLRRAAEAGDTLAMDELTELLSDGGCHEEALRWARRSAEAGNREAYLWVVWSLEALGRSSEAEQWLRDLASSGDIDARMDLAEFLKDAGREAAYWHHLQQLATDTGHMVAVHRLYRRALDAHDPIETERVLRLAIDRGNLAVVADLAPLLTGQGRDQEAADLIDHAVRVGHPNTMQWPAQQLERAGRADEAEQMLRRSLASKSVHALHRLAELLERLGRGEEAQQLRRFGARPDGSTEAPWQEA